MESSVATTHQQADVLTLGPAERDPIAASAARGGKRSVLLARILFLTDIAAATAAAATAVTALEAVSVQALTFVALAGFVWPAMVFSMGLYGGDDLRTWVSGVSEVPRGLVALLGVSWPLFGAAVVLGLARPGFLVAWTLVTTVTFSSAGRAAVRTRLHRIESLRQRTLIVGSGVVAGQLVEKLRFNQQFGLDPVGIVDDHVHDIGGPDIPRLGGLNELQQILPEKRIDRVIIAFSRASHEELLSCIRACRDHGVAVDVIPRLFEFLEGARSLDQVGGLPVLSIGTPRLARSAQIAKRALDLVVSTLCLIVIAPLMAVIAVAIKLDSPGPVFFHQPRVGRDSQVFRLIKFRSMYRDAEMRKAQLSSLNDVSDGVMFKLHDDPRVTPVGRLLRRFSLDELPQLVNVIRGEMSLVGPRPLIAPESDALDQDWHMRRLELRPGLTGPWQVYGRSQTPFQEMVRFDYQYVAGWSLARDVEILFATVPAILSGRGAY